MLFYLGRSHIVDADGNAVSGARANFYLTGTVTRTDTYSDVDRTTPHANPVVATAAGFLPPIYLDPLIEYRVVITDSFDVALPDGTVDPLTTEPDYATPYYISTPAEIAASVTPTSYQYPEGHAFRYMTAAQILDALAGTLLLDHTAAIQTVFDLSDNVVDCWIPPGYFAISESITKVESKNCIVRGVPRRSVLVNLASANKPTIKLTDNLYVHIEGIALSGRDGFPNMGMLIDATGTNKNGDFRFPYMSFETNGIGVELRMVNTILWESPEYWPTNGLGIGSEEEAAGGVRKHWLLVDEGFTIGAAENYCNDIDIRRPNIIGVDTSISGYANVKVGCPTIGGIQRFHFDGGTTEGTGGKLDLKNIYNLLIEGLYHDDAEMLLTGIREGEIVNCYNPRKIDLVGCVGVELRAVIQGDVGSTFTIDADCYGCGAVNCDFIAAPTDNGNASYFEHWRIGAVPQPDIAKGVGAVIGAGVLATTATTGFVYMPTCAGTPTGVPATQTGYVPVVFDTTNHKLYFYDGSWRDAGP